MFGGLGLALFVAIFSKTMSLASCTVSSGWVGARGMLQLLQLQR